MAGANGNWGPGEVREVAEELGLALLAGGYAERVADAPKPGPVPETPPAETAAMEPSEDMALPPPRRRRRARE